MMPPAKILQIIPTLDQSGAEKQLTLLASNLDPQRYQTRVCALTRGGHYENELREAGVQVDVLTKRFKWDLTAFWRLHRLIRDYEPDIVQTWLFAGNCYGRAAARLAKVPSVIACERCVDSWKGAYQFAIDRKLADWTDAVVANSNAVRRFYETHVRLPAEKLRVIANAAPEPKLTGDRAEKRQALSRWDIDPQAPVIGFVGRLWPQKRVQDLIWATDVLRISGWKIQLLIVGDGPRRPMLQRFARSLELQDHVRFLGHQPDVPSLIQGMDVLVLPSKFEGMPNVALEAMHLGTPVVATRIPGMDEVVVDGVTGSLVDPCKPFALAKGIDQLLRDPDRRERFAESAKDRVVERFSVENMTRAYSRLYDELLAGKSRSACPSCT
jgi:glycosyltransferase involved in cell wall biosynthesis